MGWKKRFLAVFAWIGNFLGRNVQNKPQNRIAYQELRRNHIKITVFLCLQTAAQSRCARSNSDKLKLWSILVLDNVDSCFLRDNLSYFLTPKSILNFVLKRSPEKLPNRAIKRIFRTVAQFHNIRERLGWEVPVYVLWWWNSKFYPLNWMDFTVVVKL